jgi:hypothetical protein
MPWPQLVAAALPSICSAHEYGRGLPYRDLQLGALGQPHIVPAVALDRVIEHQLQVQGNPSQSQTSDWPTVTGSPNRAESKALERLRQIALTSRKVPFGTEGHSRSVSMMQRVRNGSRARSEYLRWVPL